MVGHVIGEAIQVQGFLNDGVGEPLAIDSGVFVVVLFQYVTDHVDN